MSEEFTNSMFIGSRFEFNNLYLYPLFSEGVQYIHSSQMALFKNIPSLTSHGQILASHVPYEWVQLQLFGTYFNTTGDIPEQLPLGRSRGHKTLFDRRMVTTSLLAGEISTEFRLFQFSFGYITMPMFFEAGLFTQYEGDPIFYYGLGGGLRFYIDKVAIPAMGLELHYCINDDNPVNVAFSIGMSF